jgi:glucose/arabinose dehydrogenase
MIFGGESLPMFTPASLRGIFVSALLALTTSAAHAALVYTPVGTFDFPLAITHAGDGRLFITEKFGRIRILQPDGTVLTTPFLDIDARASGSSQDERGLLSVAFHPNYATNGFFYVNYTNNAGSTVISRFSVSTNNPNVADSNSERILLTINQDFSNHNGGQIQFGPDGMLYVGMGDGGSAGDPNCRAQSRNSLLGKMLRLDVNQNINTTPFHGIPAGNPFIAEGNIMDKVWALGLRNPWRFSFDRETGDLWLGDVGQDVQEEVHFVAFGSGGGQNFGWKIMEGTSCYSGVNGSAASDADCPANLPPCNSPLLTPATTYYTHTAGRGSITGGYVYRGAQAPQLYGKYIFADYLTGEIFSFDRTAVDNPATTTVDERISLVVDRSGTVAAFGEDLEGNLYFCNGNTVFLITSTVNAWAVY